MFDRIDERKAYKGFESFRDKLVEEGRLPRVDKPEQYQKIPVRKKSDRVNILWIMADQLRADVLGCMGNDIIKTPNIDRLAREGAIFTNSFCSSPVCAPSRATFKTGHYLNTHGVIQNNYSMFETEEVFTKRMADAGYRTASIGKTHCGRAPSEIWEHYEHVEDAFGATKPSNLPFMPENFPEIKFVADIVCDDSDSVLYGKYPGPVETTKSYALSNQAIKWLYWNDDPRPFILRVSYDDPHPPVLPPEPFASMYTPDMMPDYLFSDAKESMEGKTDTIKDFWKYNQMDEITLEDHKMHACRYYGLVSHLDAQIGRVLDYLDEIGFSDNTIVILNSDHGQMLGEHGLCHKGVTLHEGVIKIPTLIKWPGRIKPGKVIDSIVEGVDFVPTLLEMSGIEKPEGLHGKSLLPLLQGDNRDEKEYAFIQWEDFGFAIRSKEWKLIKYDSDNSGELYDLQKDPYEKVNLYEASEKKQTRLDLEEKLENWRKSYTRENLYK